MSSIINNKFGKDVNVKFVTSVSNSGLLVSIKIIDNVRGEIVLSDEDEYFLGEILKNVLSKNKHHSLLISPNTHIKYGNSYIPSEYIHSALSKITLSKVYDSYTEEGMYISLKHINNMIDVSSIYIKLFNDVVSKIKTLYKNNILFDIQNKIAEMWGFVKLPNNLTKVNLDERIYNRVELAKNIKSGEDVILDVEVGSDNAVRHEISRNIKFNFVFFGDILRIYIHMRKDISNVLNEISKINNDTHGRIMIIKETLFDNAKDKYDIAKSLVDNVEMYKLSNEYIISISLPKCLGNVDGRDILREINKKYAMKRISHL